MAISVETDDEQFEKIKQKYENAFPDKFRSFLRKRYLFMLARSVIVAREKSFYPEMKRKSTFRRLLDNWAWVIKNHEVNLLYNRFGLDIVGYKDPNDYMLEKRVRKERKKPHHLDNPAISYRTGNPMERYSIIADNKHLFYAYMESIAPKYVPKNAFIFQGDKVISPLDLKKDTKSYFNNLKDGKYICKPAVGAHGDLIVAITKSGKSIKLNNKDVTIDTLIKESKDAPFVVQEFLVQHEAINKLNSSSVNTLRIISVRWNEKTNILGAMIRLGIDKNSIVDNAGAGGTFVGINLEKGTLNEYGYYYNKHRENMHPVTKTVYKDYKIPYWKETIELIEQLHPIILGLPTIGWDIAITKDGPVVVEINSTYSLRGIQICNDGLRRRWDELKTK